MALPVPVKAVQTLLEGKDSGPLRDQIAKALPKQVSLEFFTRVIINAVHRNHKLGECTQESLLLAVMNLAEVGLVPEPFLGQIALVPFRNKRKQGKPLEAVVIPMYRGYITLGRRSGEVAWVDAQIVYLEDEFSLLLGAHPDLTHRPCLTGDRGEPIGVYAVLQYQDGAVQPPVWISADEMEAFEAKLAQQKSLDGSAWKSDKLMMWLKTAIKRLYKKVPMDVRFAKATGLDDQIELGRSQVDFLLGDGANSRPTEVGDQAETGKAKVSGDDLLAYDKALADQLEGMVKTAQKAHRDGVEDFVAGQADHHGITIDEVKAAAPGQWGPLWEAFQGWLQDKPDLKDSLTVAEFSPLQKGGLKTWEDHNKEALPSMSEGIRAAFSIKWKKIMGEDYLWTTPPGKEAVTEEQGPVPADDENKAGTAGPDPESPDTGPPGKPGNTTDDLQALKTSVEKVAKLIDIEAVPLAWRTFNVMVREMIPDSGSPSHIMLEGDMDKVSQLYDLAVSDQLIEAIQEAFDTSGPKE